MTLETCKSVIFLVNIRQKMQFNHFFADFLRKMMGIPEKVVFLQAVRGEIRTNKAFAIISRIAKKSVGNSDWYNKHGNNK